MRHLRVDRLFNPCCSAGGAAASTHQDHRAAGSWSQLVAHRTHLLNTMGAALQGRRAGVISPWPLQPFEFTSWHWQSLRTTPAAGSRLTTSQTPAVRRRRCRGDRLAGGARRGDHPAGRSRHQHSFGRFSGRLTTWPFDHISACASSTEIMQLPPSGLGSGGVDRPPDPVGSTRPDTARPETLHGSHVLAVPSRPCWVKCALSVVHRRVAPTHPPPRWGPGRAGHSGNDATRTPPPPPPPSFSAFLFLPPFGSPSFCPALILPLPLRSVGLTLSTPPVCLSVTVCPFVSVCLCLCLCLALAVFVSVSLWLCLIPCLFLSLSLSLYVAPPLSLSLSLCISVSDGR